jgi:DNA-binding response OmpR family regulator
MACGLGNAFWKRAMNSTIMIVDDDEVLGRVLTRILTRQGHRVARAGSAGQAMEMAKEHCFQLALIDLCLPDGDGIKLARQLRTEQPNLVLIMITAYPLSIREHRGLASDFTRVLVKPLDLAELRQAVEASLALCT